MVDPAYNRSRMQGEAGKPGGPDRSSEPKKRAADDQAKDGEREREDAPKSAGGAKGSKGTGRPADAERSQSNRRMLRIGIVALALVVGVVAWVATSDDDESTPAASGGVEAQIVSASELEELAVSSGHTVYWAGEIPGTELEASESPEGNFQIRYLREGTPAGGGSAGVLTVGSYPLPDPAAAVEGFAERKGSLTRESDDGREVVVSAEKPTSVYFTGADGDVQVEVYDPDYKRAMRLALSDQVQPVG